MHVRFKEEIRGGHVHVTVFVGSDVDHLANAGVLVFRQEEWPAAFAVACAPQWTFDPNEGELCREVVAMAMAFEHHHVAPVEGVGFWEMFDRHRDHYLGLALSFFETMKAARSRRREQGDKP